jgi:hypothetical protein
LYAVAAVVTGGLVVLIGMLLGTSWLERLPWILGALLTAAIIGGVGRIMPARSRAGTRALGKVRGFKEFLARVEKDRLAKLEDSPELFEKYLPYAMAFAVENKWAQAFARIAVPPPQWYSGKSGNFFPVEFVTELNSAAGQTGSIDPAARSGGLREEM